MSKTRTKPWDAVEHLKSDEEMAAYLEAALEDGDPALVAAVLGDIARAKGMGEIAREAGFGRGKLCQAPAPRGEPEPGAFLQNVRAPGRVLHAPTPTDPPTAPANH